MIMDQYFYFYLVTALSVIYATSIRITQGKLMDQKLVKAVQDKSKEINKLYAEAAKNNDKRKMDEIGKMNDELMPQMNGMLMGQMKMMVAMLGIFFVFTWVSGQFDPTQHDDFTINLTAGANNSFSGSYLLPPNANAGFWYVTVKALANESEVAMNQTVFFVGPQTEQIFWNQSKEQPMGVSADRIAYSAGDKVTLSALAPAGANSVTATFNNGTRFYVDLPVTIPLINLRRIYDSQSWFIFSAIIIGLFINPVVSLMEKIAPRKEKAQEPKTN